MFHWFKLLANIKKRSKKTYDDSFVKNKKGAYVININTPSLDTMMSKYDLCGYRTIDDSFCDVIEDIVYSLPIQSKFEFAINITDDKNTDTAKEKKQFALAFKHRYLLSSIHNEKQKRQNILLASFCLIIAILIIVGLTMIELFMAKFPDAIWELFVIAAWVFAWETFDLFAFSLPNIGFNQIRNYHLYHADFRYVKVKTGPKKIAATIDPNTVIGSFKKIEKSDQKDEAKTKTK